MHKYHIYIYMYIWGSNWAPRCLGWGSCISIVGLHITDDQELLDTDLVSLPGSKLRPWRLTKTSSSLTFWYIATTSIPPHVTCNRAGLHHALIETSLVDTATVAFINAVHAGDECGVYPEFSFWGEHATQTQVC